MKAQVNVEFCKDLRMHEDDQSFSFYTDIENGDHDEDSISCLVRDSLEHVFGRAFSIYDFKVTNLENILSRLGTRNEQRQAIV